VAANAQRGKLGILAGGGDLPGLLINACQVTNREVFVVAFRGFTNKDDLSNVAHVWTDLAAVGRTLKQLHKAECKQVVLAGPVGRPSLTSLRPDLRGAKLLPRIVKAGGDDAALKVIIAELETEGFEVLGADDILRDLLAPPGAMGLMHPDHEQTADIDRGIEAAMALGRADVGQAVVVQQGVVLGVEAVEGTDALIARCGALRMDGRGGVLVKLKKPGQERRADLPTIGLATIVAVSDAGLAGVAVESSGTLVLGLEQVAAEADKRGVFVYGISSHRLN
jgi:DUF1009 family protein